MSEATSETLNARSPARISVRSPVSRYWCSGSGGSIRDVTTSRRPGLAFFSTYASPASIAPSVRR